MFYLVKGKLSRINYMNDYFLNYDLKNKMFYITGNNFSGRISVQELMRERNELHWKEPELVEDILQWIKREHIELLI